MTQATRLPFGVALALAQRVLTVPLTAILADEKIPAVQWFTLVNIGLRGASTLAELAAADPEQPAAAAALARDGLLEIHGDKVALTAVGAERYEQLRVRIFEEGAQFLARFGPERVETARALLQDIGEYTA